MRKIFKVFIVFLMMMTFVNVVTLKAEEVATEEVVEETSGSKLAVWFDENVGSTVVTFVVSFFTGSALGVAMLSAFKAFLNKKREQSELEAEKARQERLKIQEENMKQCEVLQETVDLVKSSSDDVKNYKEEVKEIGAKVDKVLLFIDLITTKDPSYTVNGVANAYAMVNEDEEESKED